MCFVLMHASHVLQVYSEITKRADVAQVSENLKSTPLFTLQHIHSCASNSSTPNPQVLPIDISRKVSSRRTSLSMRTNTWL